MHHVVDQPFYGFQSKHLLFFCLAALLVILVTWLRPPQLPARTACPRASAAAVEGLVLFVRDEIAEKEIGHGDGRTVHAPAALVLLLHPGGRALRPHALLRHRPPATSR